MSFVIGDGNIEAIGVNERNDGEKEKQDRRGSKHDDRSREQNWLGKSKDFVEVSTRLRA